MAPPCLRTAGGEWGQVGVESCVGPDIRLSTYTREYKYHIYAVQVGWKQSGNSGLCQCLILAICQLALASIIYILHRTLTSPDSQDYKPMV